MVAVGVAAAFLLCTLGNAAAVNRVETQVNPIRKVVTMLQNMQTKITAEGEKKEKMFDAYMCYCNNADGTLGKSISDAETKIPQVTASIKEGTAMKAQLESELKEAQVARVEAKDTIAEATALQPNSRQDGSYFSNAFILGLCMIQNHPFILSIHQTIAEGLLANVTAPQLEQIVRENRRKLLELSHRLCQLTPPPLPAAQLTHSIAVDEGRARQHGRAEFSFFSSRLPDHCLLLDGGQTAVRREPHDVAANCLVFGDAPVPSTKNVGLFFAVVVNHAIDTFQGLPMLGFTRRKPADVPDLYPLPLVSKCLGESVIVGGMGEAYRRDQHEHFKIGFSKPPSSEIAGWVLDEDKISRKPPVQVRAGDILGCLYTASGRIQLWHNKKRILDFDVERPFEAGEDYYATIDVCFAAYSLTLLPMSSINDVVDVENFEVQSETKYHKVQSDTKAPKVVAEKNVIAHIPVTISTHTDSRVVTALYAAFVENFKDCDSWPLLRMQILQRRYSWTVVGIAAFLVGILSMEVGRNRHLHGRLGHL